MWLRNILPDKIENREAEGLHTGIELKSGVDDCRRRVFYASLGYLVRGI